MSDEEVVQRPAAGLSKLPPVSAPGQPAKYEVTNAQFAEQDVAFREACAKAGVPPTAAQASKYRNKKGAAYGAA